MNIARELTITVVREPVEVSPDHGWKNYVPGPLMSVTVEGPVADVEPYLAKIRALWKDTREDAA